MSTRLLSATFLLAALLLITSACGCGERAGPPDEYAPLPPADALQTHGSQAEAPAVKTPPQNPPADSQGLEDLPPPIADEPTK